MYQCNNKNSILKGSINLKCLNYIQLNFKRFNQFYKCSNIYKLIIYN